MVDTQQVSDIEQVKGLLVQVKEAMAGTFTSSDIDYLVQHFDFRELRHEASQAEIQAAIARALGEDAEESYWIEFARAARFAQDISLWLSSAKPKAYRGRRLDPQAVKRQVDLVTIVERYTQLRKSGKNFVACCPFHDDRHPSFTVYPEQQTFNCFGCSRHGDVIDFVMAAENLDFRAALAQLVGNN